jgi:hypothetical protein
MPSKETVQELVHSHATLDEPMTAAVWIHPDQAAVWLVEVLPGLPDDPDALRPIVFSPSADFRYPFHLIAGSLESLLRALPKSPDLAKAIASGEIMHDSADAQSLMHEARQIAGKQ